MDFNLLNNIVLFADRSALAILIAVGISGMWLRSYPDALRQVTVILNCAAVTCLAALAVTTIFVLFLRTASLADVSLLETWPYLDKVINKSHFGTTWLGRCSALGIAILLYLACRARFAQIAHASILAAGLYIAFLISGASHAGEDGLLTWENINNSLHIASACAWGGSVILYAFIVRKLNNSHYAVGDTAQRLTSIATSALVTVLVTGLINAWLRLTTLDLLWTSDYGLVLLTKLLFVFFMMIIGATNRFILIPALLKQESHNQIGSPSHTYFRRGLYVDSGVFFIIIGFAVSLALLSPEH